MFREHTKTVTIGNKKIGGGNPVLMCLLAVSIL